MHLKKCLYFISWLNSRTILFGTLETCKVQNIVTNFKTVLLYKVEVPKKNYSSKVQITPQKLKPLAYSILRVLYNSLNEREFEKLAMKNICFLFGIHTTFLSLTPKNLVVELWDSTKYSQTQNKSQDEATYLYSNSNDNAWTIMADEICQNVDM